MSRDDHERVDYGGRFVGHRCTLPAMNADLIAPVFTGLTGLIVALGAYTANRQRRTTQEYRKLRRDFRTLQKQLVATLGHVFELEIRMASSGLPVPERPKILEELDDDDDAAQPAAPPERPTPSDGDRTRSP